MPSIAVPHTFVGLIISNNKLLVERQELDDWNMNRLGCAVAFQRKGQGYVKKKLDLCVIYTQILINY